MAFDLVGKAVKNLKLPTVDYNSGSINVIHAQKGDVNSRFLNVVLYDDTGDISLKNYNTATLNATLPDGTPQFEEGEINKDKNTIICKLPSSMLEILGKVSCDITLFGNGSSLTSQTFYILVRQSQANDEAIEGMDEYTTLSKLLEASKNTDIRKCSNALKGTVSGGAVAMKDVSPVEHTMAVKVESKNLLPYPYKNSTKTVNDITFTDNGDGTITVNGTATADAVFECYVSNNELITDTSIPLRLSGCPQDGSDDTYYLMSSWIGAQDFGRGKQLTGENRTRGFSIVIKAGTTVENIVFKPQLEIGTVSTEYTPYVDVSKVKVSRYGKNLFNNDTSKLNEVTFVGKDETTVTKNGYEIHLPPGEYTLTATRLADKNIYIYTRVNNSGEYVTGAFKDKRGNTEDGYILALKDNLSPCKYSIKDGDVIYIYDAVSTDNTYSKGKFGEVLIQIEAGEVATDYEPYVEPIEYTPNTDGTVEGITSVYPSTTLLCDTENTVITAEYNRDLNKAFAELYNAMISLGGNV